MDDQLLLKLITQTVTVLEEMPPIPQDLGPLIGSYNSMLRAAKSNHPEMPFIQEMATIEKADKYQVQILLTQLRIVLEALQEGSGSAPGGSGRVT